METQAQESISSYAARKWHSRYVSPTSLIPESALLVPVKSPSPKALAVAGSPAGGAMEENSESTSGGWPRASCFT